MNERFTIDGSEKLEARLKAVCDDVLKLVRATVSDGKLEALLLGGGYGRGQGGVLRTSSGDEPYNDMEFYVCLRGSRLLNERKFRKRLHEIGEKLSPGAGLEVEFKIITVAELCSGPVTMFFYDLIMGHRLLWGAPSLFQQCDHLRDPEKIPRYEATRLLMNRCTGLLFSEERLRRPNFGAEESDFVGRNHAKAEMAFGDVLLAAHGLYHWDCRERHRRLLSFSPKERPPWLLKVQASHQSGVEFKLHPGKKDLPVAVFREKQAELVDLGLCLWLWLESRRLSRTFSSPEDYVFSTVNKCPETSGTKNRLVNARTFGPASLFLKASGRYPRERLFNSLVLLLWAPGLETDGRLGAKLQSELRTSKSGFVDWVRAYEQLWQRFN